MPRIAVANESQNVLATGHIYSAFADASGAIGTDGFGASCKPNDATIIIAVNATIANSIVGFIYYISFELYYNTNN